MSTEPEVLTPNLPGKKKASNDAPARAWFDDEDGFTGEPIEYGGQQFYAREVEKADLRRFTRETQRITRETTALGKAQTDELKALQAENPDAELPSERLDYYDGESERLVDELNGAYDALLQKGIVGWSLSRPFSHELLARFDKVDKVALCQAIGSRSTSGFDAVKNSPGRSKR